MVQSDTSQASTPSSQDGVLLAVARIIDEHAIGAVEMHGRDGTSERTVRDFDAALAKAKKISIIGPAHLALADAIEHIKLLDATRDKIADKALEKPVTREPTARQAEIYGCFDGLSDIHDSKSTDFLLQMTADVMKCSPDEVCEALLAYTVADALTEH